MSEDEYKGIYERIGLTVDEADSCWDHDCINDFDSKYFDDPAKVLSEIISDDELSVKQKIYLTWLYGYTLEKRIAFNDNNNDAR
jgi:hypothetical protein